MTELKSRSAVSMLMTALPLGFFGHFAPKTLHANSSTVHASMAHDRWMLILLEVLELRVELIAIGVMIFSLLRIV